MSGFHDSDGRKPLRIGPQHFHVPDNEFTSRFVDQFFTQIKDTDMGLSKATEIERKIENYHEEIARLRAEKERLEKRPPDDFNDGGVVSFSKSYDGGTTWFEYVAIKARGKWYASGQQTSGRPLGWSQLLDFAFSHGEVDIFWATSWEKIGD